MHGNGYSISISYLTLLKKAYVQKFNFSEVLSSEKIEAIRGDLIVLMRYGNEFISLFISLI